MIVQPCAKINLGLNIVGLRTDGYHDIETIFYPIPITDTLEVMETVGRGVVSLVVTNDDTLVGDNLVCRAYRKVAERYTLPSVAVTLTKGIPTQAGLGGGSSDCAAMINILNDMFVLGMSMEEKQGIAASLGADCPFFINPSPQLATGIGDVLSPVEVSLRGYYLVIVKPPVAVSTREAYAHTTPRKPVKPCWEIVRQPINTWRGELVNDFEESVFTTYPQLSDLKAQLYAQGAVYASMSGSGSAFFALFTERPNLTSFHSMTTFTTEVI